MPPEALGSRHHTNSQPAALCSLQDNYGFPQVERSLPQLQQYAESLRAKTSKFRTLSNQVATTRLLAQQGFDAGRWGIHAGSEACGAGGAHVISAPAG
jgi:hypothetical protein